MRGWATQHAVMGAIVLIAALVHCATADASPAPSPPEAAEVSIYLPSPDHSRILSLEVFPAEGVAVARTAYGKGERPGSGASYSEAITAAPFDGSLDLNFPGLGEFVGTVTLTKARGPVEEARVCEERYPVEYARFEGRIAFHGAGDSRRWSATKAEAAIEPACGARLEQRNGPKTVFHHLEGGPPIFGSDYIHFLTTSETRTRRTEFFAIGDLRDEEPLTLLAFDSEWLPGEIATQRWVESFPNSSFAKVVHLRRGGTNPSQVIVTPPAPFFGRGIYLKRTGEMTGSLGVHFPGLTRRLAQPPAEVTFDDEEPRG